MGTQIYFQNITIITGFLFRRISFSGEVRLREQSDSNTFLFWILFGLLFVFIRTFERKYSHWRILWITTTKNNT